MHQLSDAGFKILALLKNVKEMHKNNIAASLKESAEITQARLDLLLEYNYIESSSKFVEDKYLSGFIDAEKYSITDLGSKTLEDFYAATKQTKTKIQEDRFWKLTAIIISAIPVLLAIIAMFLKK